MSETKTRSAMPKRNTAANDLVSTPLYLAFDIIHHFKPFGRVLDPCSGNGVFIEATRSLMGKGLRDVNEIGYGDISTGRDFFTQPYANYDWIVSNPPYSILTGWLERSFEVAHNVVYLIQPTAAFFTARRRAAFNAGFGIKEIYYVECPDEWKAQKLSFGVGLAAVWWQRGYKGDIVQSGYLIRYGADNETT